MRRPPKHSNAPTAIRRETQVAGGCVDADSRWERTHAVHRTAPERVRSLRSAYKSVGLQAITRSFQAGLPAVACADGGGFRQKTVLLFLARQAGELVAQRVVRRQEGALR